ncbi:MAG: hypothetical protein DMG70_07515 [Acidobacteria bacterium]|nr:MAG: hypothetical protein DMG70_07515 [Acidobacteriota bacterium]PYY05991.1 MAG: hypothetical protein DMG69_24835 [Acidobacteriota bacterium]
MVGAEQTPSRARSDTVIATRLGIVLRAILGFIIGIEVFFRGFRALRRKWLIESTPPPLCAERRSDKWKYAEKWLGPTP